MALNLTRRLVKGEPLTAEEHDANLDALEMAVRAVRQVDAALPERPHAADWPPVFWFTWSDPTGAEGPMAPLDQWFQIPEPPAPAVPDPFTDGMWSVSANGEVTITSLPASDPEITDIEYRINEGAEVSFGESTTGTYPTTAEEGDEVQIRAVNSEGESDWSEPPKAVPAPASVPAQFTEGQWSVTDTGAGGTIGVTVSALPAADPSIDSIEYRIDGGTWTAFDPALTGTGTRTISGLTDDVEIDVNLRAINSVGPADDPGSDTKQVTPTEAEPGGDLAVETVLPLTLHGHAINLTKTFSVDLSPYVSGDLVLIATQTGRIITEVTIGGQAATPVVVSEQTGRRGGVFAFEMTGEGSADTEIFVEVDTAGGGSLGFDGVFVARGAQVAHSAVANAGASGTANVTMPAAPNVVFGFAGSSDADSTDISMSSPQERDVGLSVEGSQRRVAVVGWQSDVSAGAFGVSATVVGGTTVGIFAVALEPKP